MKHILDLKTQYTEDALYSINSRAIDAWSMRCYMAENDCAINIYQYIGRIKSDFMVGISTKPQIDVFLALYLLLYNPVFNDSFVFKHFEDNFFRPIDVFKESENPIYYQLFRKISKNWNEFYFDSIQFIEETLNNEYKLSFFSVFFSIIYPDANHWVELKRKFKKYNKIEKSLFFENVKRVFLQYTVGVYPLLDEFLGIYAHSNWEDEPNNPFEITIKGQTFHEIISNTPTCLQELATKDKNSPIYPDIENAIELLGLKFTEKDAVAFIETTIADSNVIENYAKVRGTQQGSKILSYFLFQYLNSRSAGGVYNEI